MTVRSEADDLLQQLCKGFRAGTHKGRAGDDGTLYELPLSYTDGQSIDLLVERGGRVTDDGKTLLRLIARDRLASFEKWPGISGYLRDHRIAREGPELIFTGTTPLDLVRFIQGLKDLELKVPDYRVQSEDFDDFVRSAVREHLDKAVASERITEQDYDHIVHPKHIITTPEGASIRVRADFGSRNKTELVVILSHGGEASWQRDRHIRDKLAEHALMRGTNGVRSLAVIPADGQYETEEENLILAFTGQPAFKIDRKRGWKKLYDRLVTVPGLFGE